MLLALGLFQLFITSTAQHFETVYSNNPYNPMSIIINTATIDGLNLDINDEIAVFDINEENDEICVGYIILTGTFNPDTNYIITTSADDPATDEQDGFVSGNDIIFRYWDNSEGYEIVLTSAVYNNLYDETFQPMGTAVTDVTGSTYQTWTGLADTNWTNVANWNYEKLPTSYFDVIIPSNPTGSFFPSVSTMDAACRNITIETNAEIKIHGKLTIGYSGPPNN